MPGQAVHPLQPSRHPSSPHPQVQHVPADSPARIVDVRGRAVRPELLRQVRGHPHRQAGAVRGHAGTAMWSLGRGGSNLGLCEGQVLLYLWPGCQYEV